MTPDDKPAGKVSVADIADVRHLLSVLHAQAQSGQVDNQFLIRQIEKTHALLEAIEDEYKLTRQRKRFESLYEVSRALGTSLNLPVVLDQVMDAIIHLSGAERGFLMLRDDHDDVSVKAARNFDQQTLSDEQFKYSRGVVYFVLEKGEAVFTTNAAEDPRFGANDSIINQKLRSIIAVPLRVRGRVFGVIYADTSSAVHFMDETTLQTLEAFATQAAFAIDNAQLFIGTDQKLAARILELQQLRRIDLLLNETLDAAKAFQITVDSACRQVNAEIGHLGIMQDNKFPAVYHYGLSADETQPIFLERVFPQIAEVAESRKSSLTNKGKFGLLFAPIVKERRVIGMIVLRREGVFTADEQETVERIAARAANAIENARLYSAVQAADRAKSEFVGIVAHDLKVPMTSILGYADLALLDDNLPESQVVYINRVRDTVHRMEKLVGDLADVSRIESGLFRLEESPVSIDRIVQGVRDAVIVQINARKHRYVEQIEPELPRMRVDYYRLLQVLINLISNAYKYTPDGGTIGLSVERDPLKKDHIQFTVSDTGIGLSEAALKKLGVRFWRADDDFTLSQQGTGLGFTIARSLIEQMGSNIQIQSIVGRGSIFIFSIAIDRGNQS
ncbi:MAG: GAF domain-containing sensor histidine kinase [Anaerolineae bacterium]|nr:GAF domain-containing sensor histidine kinase [Anaerolineae bacterium]